MKRITFLMAILFLTLLSYKVNAQIEQSAIERRIGFGAEFGVIGATIDGEYFGMAFSGDYLVGRNFSLAEIISFIPSGDLTMFSANTVARFNIPMQGFSIIPYLGVGLVYGNLSNEKGGESAFSLAFPIGTAVTIDVAANIEAVGRFQLSLSNLDYGALGEDKGYFELMVGFRYSP